MRLRLKIFKMIKRLIGSMVAMPISRCLLMIGCLMYVSGCVAILPTPKVTLHDDNYVVMETHDQSSLTSRWGMIKISREFYRHYEDVFDLLVLVYDSQKGISKQWGSDTLGRMVVVRNTETGTGTKLFDIGKDFGSASRLRGVVQLLTHEQIIDGSLLHEIMHLWVGRIEVIPTEFETHWGFSSVWGLLGGFQRDALVDLGGGVYSAGDFYPRHNWGFIPYSALEMYLAGWASPIEVPEIWVAEDGAWLSRKSSPVVLDEYEIKNEPLPGESDQDTSVRIEFLGNKIFTASKISTWTIEQIIEKIGPRTLSFEHSQKEFRVAFVLVRSDDNILKLTDLKTIEVFIEEFTAHRPIAQEKFEIKIQGSTEPMHMYNFWEATKGIATLEASDLQSFRK